MRKIKRFVSIFVAAALVCSAMIIGGCSKEKGQHPERGANTECDSFSAWDYCERWPLFISYR